MLENHGKNVLMWRNLGHLHSEIELSLLQEITYSAGHLLQHAHKHSSLSFLMAKKVHLSDSPVSLPSLLTPLHMGTYAYASIHTRGMTLPLSLGRKTSIAIVRSS